MITKTKKSDSFFILFLAIAFIVGGTIYAYGQYHLSPGRVLASSCPPGQFCGGSVSPVTVPAGGNYTLSCDYGYVGNGIYANPESGSCKYQKFSGTAAQFSCTAGQTPGTFSNSCKLSSVAEPYPSRTDSAGPLTVSSVSSCPAGQFCGGSVSPTSVGVGGNYTMSCDYGYVGNGITANPGSGSCTYQKFSGTAAQFSCTAGQTPGTFSNSCKFSSASPNSLRTDTVSAMTVTGNGTTGGGDTGNGSLVPAGATAISNIESLGNWKWEHDLGTPGNSIGLSALVSDPLGGSSRQFFVVYGGYGGERYSVSLGTDPVATHFVYEASIYLVDPASVQNLEMDMNQVTSDGNTVIYGTQCSSLSKTWEYTVSVSGRDHWKPSNIPCDPTAWTPNTWHHVQIAYHRDGKGNVTYDAVNLDGTVSYFSGATGNSSFQLGWRKGAMVMNLQLDGVNQSGWLLAYTNKMTVWRW